MKYLALLALPVGLASVYAGFARAQNDASPTPPAQNQVSAQVENTNPVEAQKNNVAKVSEPEKVEDNKVKVGAPVTLPATNISATGNTHFSVTGGGEREGDDNGRELDD